VGDVRREADMEQMAARTIANFGRINMLIAAAGVLRGPSGSS
jgi:NAD(P)-dependent dehydrogenase (short-subunit alcohol dehydrogenase family)